MPTSDHLEHPPAKLKRFERWRQRCNHSDGSRRPVLEVFTISQDTNQRYLQESLRRAAFSSQTDTADMVAHARLPYLDNSIPPGGGEYAHLYIVHDVFDVEQGNVVWMFDGDARAERNVQCAVGEVECVLEKVKMLGLIRRVREGNEASVQRKVWTRLDMWVKGQW